MAVGSSMQTTAEEVALQEQVTKALESQGVLGQIKAQLRAAVFQALHGRTSDRTLSPRPSQSSLSPCNTLVQAYGDDAQVALELVRNMLECLQLDHTLAVFLAEANVESEVEKMSQWRSRSLLCEYVGVNAGDEQMPVLVKMVQRRVREPVGQHEIWTTATSSLARETVKTTPLEIEPPLQKQHVHRESCLPTSTKGEAPSLPIRAAPEPPREPERVDAGEQEEDMEASMAEEIASGSFEEESVVESQSASFDTQHGKGASGRFVNHDEEHESDDEGKSDTLAADDQEEVAHEPPEIASPPPVPTKLGALPPLPGRSGLTRTPQSENNEDGEIGIESEEDESVLEEDEEEEAEDEEDLDEDAAAARLRALEEKLKQMEAEDDTGVLHQLKATALDERDERAAERDQLSPSSKAGKSEGDNEDYEDDNYGSDFEEEVEEEEEADDEEFASEMSESIASVSVLSESEDAAPKPTLKALDALENDLPVDSEDALNSYDYIEAVERDW